MLDNQKYPLSAHSLMKAKTNHGKSIVSGKILLKTNKQQEGGEKRLRIWKKIEKPSNRGDDY